MSLACRGISAGYPGGGANVLRDVSLEVARGRVLGVAGPSGCGKTTLLRCLGGTLASAEGRVEADGFIAVVQQMPEQQLFAPTVLDEVMFGPRNQGLGEDEARERATWALELFGFDTSDEAFLARSPLRCSGGEKRRIALADMVAMRPDYLLLDEPTAGLDPSQARGLVGVVRRLAAGGMGVAVVSHDMDMLAECADDLVIIANGVVAALGEAGAVLGDVELLRACGLEPSYVCELAARLRARGVDLPVGVCTAEGLAAALAAARAAGPAAPAAGEAVR
ncbi:energy-coupling factor ABC transporter ATP-binding protein [Paratractidigestivibacter sp.]|uniref:energy-coupling factor ABC transporter ATP-binding protein n=1 Tax=Paratractidigestivibacter sp. TaxID=2847316 RepID=UPI002AC9BDC7|nr:ATP-binding cassette domain-containing protein [Paratractidigestivibacter sp.]